MFSEVQRNFIQQFVLANKKEYPYYIAYTQTNINQYGGSTGDDYNFYIIISNKPITATDGYTYTLTGNIKRYGVRSANATYNYHNQRVQQLSTLT